MNTAIKIVIGLISIALLIWAALWIRFWIKDRLETNKIRKQIKVNNNPHPCYIPPPQIPPTTK